MGKLQKKGQRGSATNYITRTQAVKKLQLTLPDFRKICILKGIYPHEPKKKRKLAKGSSAPKTFYYVKDIQYLAHEPLLEKFAETKVFVRKIKKALGRDEFDAVQRTRENKPKYTLDHIVKERYPNFADSLKDLDDALCLIFLFSTMPRQGKVQPGIINKCRILAVEFMHYVIAAKCVKKVFVSIKGIYVQADIDGNDVTWIIPHQFTTPPPSNIDFKVMLSFLEIYTTVLGFVNFKLYSNLNLVYPPKALEEVFSEKSAIYYGDNIYRERLESLNIQLAEAQKTDEEEEIDEELLTADQSLEEILLARKEEENFKTLFSDCKFFLGREVPREILVLTIKSLGGEVSWGQESGAASIYPESDEQITHQIVDRPSQSHQFLSRCYIQPQWIFDSINQRKLLPVDEFVAGSVLPPHLSPFVQEEGYMPPEQVELLDRNSKKEEEAAVAADEKKAVMDAEEKRLAVMAMPKKRKALYNKMVHSNKKKASAVNKLKRKREEIDEDKNTKKAAKAGS